MIFILYPTIFHFSWLMSKNHIPIKNSKRTTHNKGQYTCHIHQLRQPAHTYLHPRPFFTEDIIQNIQTFNNVFRCQAPKKDKMPICPPEVDKSTFYSESFSNWKLLSLINSFVAI